MRSPAQAVRGAPVRRDAPLSESMGVNPVRLTNATGLLALGLISVVLFSAGWYYPIWLSVVVFLAGTAYIVHQVATARTGALMLLLWTVYAMPFIHIVGYVTFDFSEGNTAKLFEFWRFFPNDYMLDRNVIEIMSMIGAVGALGFCLGVQLNTGRPAARAAVTRAPRVLAMPLFLVLLTLAVVLAWVRAPQETILTARYGESRAISDTWNFSSAWFFSACFVVLCFVDAMLDHLNRTKLWLTVATALFILLWLNLARGDREGLTMGFALIVSYFYWGKRLPGTPVDVSHINWKAFLGLAVLLFYVQLVASSARDYVAGFSLSELADFLEGLYEGGLLNPINAIHGTWSSALVTPLSVAGDYFHGTLPLRYGRSYADLALSVVPGFVANWIGYVRPLDNQGDLAWAMTYGIGGIHAVVMPFYDFRIVGVFAIIAGWAYACSRLESSSLNFDRLCLLAMIAVAAPWWLWYGEKAIINAVIIWWLLTRAYRIFATATPRTIARSQPRPAMC